MPRPKLLEGIEGERNKTKAVDHILSRELMQLSVNDRAALEEEIHGVRCLAPEETPELLQLSLQKLAMVLENDQIIPRDQKQAYLRSQGFPMTYVNGENFRLRFLRMTLFDPIQAARNITSFLEAAHLFYGDVLLQRPPRISDFNKKESQFIRNGLIQFLPFRDRSGRRVCVCINPSPYHSESNKDWLEKISEDDLKRKTKMFLSGKHFLYTAWVAGDDIEDQRKGVVFIVWFDRSFQMVTGNGLSSYAPAQFGVKDVCTIRVAAIHICAPDTLSSRFVSAMIAMSMRSHGRMKLRSHYGESTEVLYRLQSYGIPTEHIPISFSGTVKTGYLKQWTRAREAQESTMYLELGADIRDIIECPQLNDVLFRQGISLIWNPGNAKVRTLICNMQQEQQKADSNKTVKLKRREMVLDIIDEVGKTSRFLMWNEGGWWNEIIDRDQLILKIEYLIKEVRKSKREERQQLKLHSSTSLFCTSNKKPRVNESGGNNTDSSDEERSFGCGSKTCFGDGV